MWPKRVCWSRLVAVNRIAIMMAYLRLSRPSVSVGVSSALEVYQTWLDHFPLFSKLLFQWSRIFSFISSLALAQSCTRFWGFIGLPAFPSLVRYVFLLPSLLSFLVLYFVGP